MTLTYMDIFLFQSLIPTARCFIRCPILRAKVAAATAVTRTSAKKELKTDKP